MPLHSMPKTNLQRKIKYPLKCEKEPKGNFLEFQTISTYIAHQKEKKIEVKKVKSAK